MEIQEDPLAGEGGGEVGRGEEKDEGGDEGVGGEGEGVECGVWRVGGGLGPGEKEWRERIKGWWSLRGRR